MAKTRISISLDPEDAELLKQVAAKNGLDVSAFLVLAGRNEAARLARVDRAFSEIDAAIAQAEAEADTITWPPACDVSPSEAQRIDAEIDATRARAVAARRTAAA